MSETHRTHLPEAEGAFPAPEENIPRPSPEEARRSRLLRIFKRLRPGRLETVPHRLDTFPVVDVYRLDYFPVVSSEDGSTYDAWVNFYLYHSSDRVARLPAPGEGRVSLDPSRGPLTRLPLERLLAEHGVPYDGGTSLGDVVNEFWKALFREPNDPFDETAHANSPWLDRSCGDRRTVDELRRTGDWDDLWLRFRPRKTINHPRASDSLDPRLLQAMGAYHVGNIQEAIAIVNQVLAERAARGFVPPAGAPSQVEVTQIDYDTVGLRLLPPYDRLHAGDPDAGEPAVPPEAEIVRDELNVMVLLHP